MLFINTMLMLFLTPHPQVSHAGGPCRRQSKNNVWEWCRLFWENYNLFLRCPGRKSLVIFFFLYLLMREEVTWVKDTGWCGGTWETCWYMPPLHGLIWHGLFWYGCFPPVKPSHSWSLLTWSLTYYNSSWFNCFLVIINNLWSCPLHCAFKRHSIGIYSYCSS